MWGYLVACGASSRSPIDAVTLVSAIASATRLQSDVRGRLLWCVGLHTVKPEVARVNARGDDLDLVKEVVVSTRAVFECIAQAASAFDEDVLQRLSECLHQVAIERGFAWSTAMPQRKAPLAALQRAMRLAAAQTLGMDDRPAREVAIAKGYERSARDAAAMRFTELEWDWD